jgi:MoaD family protein
MKVKVNYFGQFKQITGKETDDKDCPETIGLCQFLTEIASHYGHKFKTAVFDQADQLRPSVVVLVNGNVVDKDRPPSLNDGDEVSLLTAIGGG